MAECREKAQATTQHHPRKNGLAAIIAAILIAVIWSLTALFLIQFLSRFLKP
jgi:hypothetical protein